jgi:two-component system response regulator TctD
MRILLAEDECELATWRVRALEQGDFRAGRTGGPAGRADPPFPGSDRSRFACGPLICESGSKQYTLGSDVFPVTPREHGVLRALIQHSGEPLSKQEILERVFSDDRDVHPEAVEVLVHRLRKRLEASTVRITTLRGLGYVLETAA